MAEKMNVSYIHTGTCICNSGAVEKNFLDAESYVVSFFDSALFSKNLVRPWNLTCSLTSERKYEVFFFYFAFIWSFHTAYLKIIIIIIRIINSSCYFLSAFCGSLYEIASIILFIPNYPIIGYSHFPQFIDKETKSSQELPKVTQPAGVKNNIWTQWFRRT